MNWYKEAQFNMLSPEVSKIASIISSMIVAADKGRIVDDPEIHKIVSRIPSEYVLQQAVDMGLRSAAYITGIMEITPAREDIIRRINNTWTY